MLLSPLLFLYCIFCDLLTVGCGMKTIFHNVEKDSDPVFDSVSDLSRYQWREHPLLAVVHCRYVFDNLKYTTQPKPKPNRHPPPPKSRSTRKTSRLCRALWGHNGSPLTQTFHYSQRRMLFSTTWIEREEHTHQRGAQWGLMKHENSKHLSKAACSSKTPTCSC